eukprot:scaffold639961_cov18-Prasinocladus_malaysianus.AAC.1
MQLSLLFCTIRNRNDQQVVDFLLGAHVSSDLCQVTQRALNGRALNAYKFLCQEGKKGLRLT